MLKWLTIFIFLVVFVTIVVINLGGLQPLVDFIYSFPNGDRIVHIFLSGILAFLVNASLFPRKVMIRGRAFLMGTLLVVGFVTLDEFSQLFIPGRSADLIDLAASYLGILVASLLFHRWRGKDLKISQ